MRLPPMAPGDRLVPWLDKCHPDWSFKPIKYLCDINARVLPERTDPNTELTYIDITSVNSNGTWSASEPMIFADAPTRARRIVRDGDILISTVRTYLRAITHIHRANNNMICSTGFAVLTARAGIFPRFLAYWVRSNYFVDEIVARSVGVSYPAINSSDVGSLPLPALDIQQQISIADFLDRETERIDALIAKKERQTELLQEKRAALISHIVTKGLNPDVKMKDSGIEWLEQIPEHWETRPLKYVTSFINGAPFKPEDWEDDGIPIIRIENLNRGEEFNFTRKDIPVKYHIRKGDLLFGWSGNRGTSFGPFLWWREALHYLNQHIFHLVGCSCDRKWLYWTLKAVTYFVEKQAHGIIGLVHITKADLGAIAIPVISEEEQRLIADYLEVEIRRVDELTARVQGSIEKLREYRTALISTAVTGKIDVRGKGS